MIKKLSPYKADKQDKNNSSQMEESIEHPLVKNDGAKAKLSERDISNSLIS